VESARPCHRGRSSLASSAGESVPPISAKATQIHGYTDADVAAPPFAAVFRSFRRSWIRRADCHNGHHFDIPVCTAGRGQAGVDTLAFYDTLLLAARCRALAHRRQTSRTASASTVARITRWTTPSPWRRCTGSSRSSAR